MDRQKAPTPARLGHGQTGQRSSSKPDVQHVGRVSAMVSKLVPPSPPRQEAALWAIASCDTLSHGFDYPGNVPSNNLRETCETVKKAVEQANHWVNIYSFLHPLDTAEREEAAEMISDACRKYFYILAMSLKLQPGDNLVRVAPSRVHGLGVFAAWDIRKHTCYTAYPIDLLVLHEGAPEPGLRPLVVFSRHRNSEVEAHKRLKKQLIDYGMDIAPGVTVYADPSTHSPGCCGHMINDPRGAGVEANCVECPIGGGALTGAASRLYAQGREPARTEKLPGRRCARV